MRFYVCSVCMFEQAPPAYSMQPGKTIATPIGAILEAAASFYSHLFVPPVLPPPLLPSCLLYTSDAADE